MDEYFFGITDKGKRREKNEDTFIAGELPGKEFVVACVIDGVGGYSGGEVAAEIARSVIIEHLQDLSGDVTRILKNAIVAANARIQEEKKKGPENEHMACVLTCVVTHIKKNKFYYAHVGDTRLYLLRDHSLVKLSKDHSVVGFLEESGRLSEEDAMRHPMRNEINKALGFEENIDELIETGESPFLPGDLLLLCSDGLSDMIGSNMITSILTKRNSLEARARKLVDAANDAGGNDNITAVLVMNHKTPVQQVALKPEERRNGHVALPQLQETKPTPEKGAVTVTKANRVALVFMAFLSVALLTTLLVVLFQNNYNSKQAINNKVVNSKALKTPNQPFGQLISRVNDSTKVYAWTQPGISLEVAAPIMINKDSFHLKGNGGMLKADSGYTGAAVLIGPSAKQVVLDSMVFENFDVAIIVQKDNVILRNVRFINCRVPIQYLLSFKDSVISGRLRDSIFIPIKKHKSP